MNLNLCYDHCRERLSRYHGRVLTIIVRGPCQEVGCHFYGALNRTMWGPEFGGCKMCGGRRSVDRESGICGDCCG